MKENPYYLASWKNPVPAEPPRPWYSDPDPKAKVCPPGAAFIGCFWSMLIGGAIAVLIGLGCYLFS